MSGENEMERLTLISHHLCPYVQRAAIALAEKGIPFERVYVDLAAKPDWFKAISPLGKVPVLRVGQASGEETSIFESAVILEYWKKRRLRRCIRPIASSAPGIAAGSNSAHRCSTASAASIRRMTTRPS